MNECGVAWQHHSHTSITVKKKWTRNFSIKWMHFQVNEYEEEDKSSLEMIHSPVNIHTSVSHLTYVLPKSNSLFFISLNDQISAHIIFNFFPFLIYTYRMRTESTRRWYTFKLLNIATMLKASTYLFLCGCWVKTVDIPLRLIYIYLYEFLSYHFTLCIIQFSLR